MNNSQTVTGRVTVIQEERFRLILDDGRGLLLTLGRGAATGIAELDRIKRRGARVRVEFTGEPNERTGIARAVHLIESR